MVPSTSFKHTYYVPGHKYLINGKRKKRKKGRPEERKEGKKKERKKRMSQRINGQIALGEF